MFLGRSLPSVWLNYPWTRLVHGAGSITAPVDDGFHELRGSFPARPCEPELLDGLAAKIENVIDVAQVPGEIAHVVATVLRQRVPDMRHIGPGIIDACSWRATAISRAISLVALLLVVDSFTLET